MTKLIFLIIACLLIFGILYLGFSMTTHKKFPSTFIHPSVIIEGDVQIGKGTKIGPYSFLKGPLIIGCDNQIGANVQIGVDPEHINKDPVGLVHIGNNNTLREFTVIQRGTGYEETRIEDNCNIMAYCYIAHDCCVESGALLCARVTLGGYCRVLKNASIGMSVSLHPYTTVGSHAFIGLGSVVVKDVPPFFLVMGNPARFYKINEFQFKELKLEKKYIYFEKGHIGSDNFYMKECIEIFEKKSKRSPILSNKTN